MKIQNISLFAIGLALIFSACASAPEVLTKEEKREMTGKEASIYDESRQTTILEFVKTSSKSITNGSNLAMVVSKEFGKHFSDIRKVNLVFSNHPASEVTARGDLDWIREGVIVANREKGDIVVFIDCRVSKRARDPKTNKNAVSAVFTAWGVDPKKERHLFTYKSEEYGVLEDEATLGMVEEKLKETVSIVARRVGIDSADYINRYLK